MSELNANANLSLWAGNTETLGALLHEIAYAPAMSFVYSPTAGELMRLIATRLLKEI